MQSLIPRPIDELPAGVPVLALDIRTNRYRPVYRPGDDASSGILPYAERGVPGRTYLPKWIHMPHPECEGYVPIEAVKPAVKFIWDITNECPDCSGNDQPCDKHIELWYVLGPLLNEHPQLAPTS